MTKADYITNADFWELSKYISKDSLTHEENEAWTKTLNNAYSAFMQENNREHRSVLDFVLWFFSRAETGEPYDSQNQPA